MTEATSRHVHEAPAVERAPSGVDGLDLALGGGLIRGGIYLVMGRPGTGKTTLANQLCFAHVAAGGRAAYVTLLSESHASMMKNLQTMRFFDPEAVNRSLVYVGAYRALRDEKLKGLLGRLRQVIRDERASLLVLDGVSPTRALAGSDLALKEFIVELQMLGSMTDCTTLLFANMDADDANGPEHTMVDGLLELAFERTHRVTRRTLEVIKFRGSRHLLGKHELSITDAGVAVHPRTEDVIDVGARPPAPTGGRLPTGVERLDAMLGGGLVASTTAVVLGFTGSGKTTLGMHFLAAGAAAGESCFYFGFYESPARLLEQGDSLGLELSRHTAEDRLYALWQPPYRYGLDALAERLLGEVRRRGVKRLVIDGLDGYWQATIEPSRTIRYLTALSNELRSLGVTTLITSETSKPYGPEIAMRIEGASALVDSLILLEYLTVGTDLRRLLSVVKQRGGWHETAMREFALTSSGLVLSPDASSAEDLLSGGDGATGRRNRKARQSEGALARTQPSRSLPSVSPPRL
ncbi:MAG TPA: ATPase domain-containing protein, partial [Polyangiaceae bacterium]|nr:ATPase domain-containing protein [Polyangiaceae bacterium]